MASKRFGTTNGRAKLDDRRVQQVRDLCRLADARGSGAAHVRLVSQRAVAQHMGLSQSTVADIVNGRLWAHLPDVPASALRPLLLDTSEHESAPQASSGAGHDSTTPSTTRLANG